jgi:hypothetical protein
MDNIDELANLRNKIVKGEFPFVKEALDKIATGSVGPKEISVYELIAASLLSLAADRQASTAEIQLRSAQSQSAAAEAQGKSALRTARAMNWLTGALVLVGMADIIIRLVCE